jgi:hypothetical protein
MTFWGYSPRLAAVLVLVGVSLVRPAHADAACGPTSVLYLNFEGEGGPIRNSDYCSDARNNCSAINRRDGVQYPAFKVITEWRTTREEFIAEIARLVQEFYTPFNVLVVTARPTDQSIPYTMAMMGGTGDSIGIGNGPAGIAPRDCSNRNQWDVAFVFTDHIQRVAQWYLSLPMKYLARNIATTTVHETAHTFGLRHTSDPEDVMYPKNAASGPVSFKNVAMTETNVEFVPQADATKPLVERLVTPAVGSCGGGSTQNSYELLMATVGPASCVSPTLLASLKGRTSTTLPVDLAANTPTRPTDTAAGSSPRALRASSRPSFEGPPDGEQGSEGVDLTIATTGLIGKVDITIRPLGENRRRLVRTLPGPGPFMTFLRAEALPKAGDHELIAVAWTIDGHEESRPLLLKIRGGGANADGPASFRVERPAADSSGDTTLLEGSPISCSVSSGRSSGHPEGLGIALCAVVLAVLRRPRRGNSSSHRKVGHSGYYFCAGFTPHRGCKAPPKGSATPGGH